MSVTLPSPSLTASDAAEAHAWDEATPEAATDHAPAAVAEEHRWLRLLVIPFLLGAVFFASAVATGALWLMGPAMLFGAGVLIGSFVYLALSSDSNARA